MSDEDLTQAAYLADTLHAQKHRDETLALARECRERAEAASAAANAAVAERHAEWLRESSRQTDALERIAAALERLSFGGSIR